MKTKALIIPGLGILVAWSMICPASPARAQNIGWGPATGITGDANLASGVYYDAFLPNTGAPSPLTVDGITFNVDETVSSSSTSDGIITVTANSGSLSDYNGSSFPTTASASPAFAAVMNAGGIYQTGGTNTGTISISGLTTGQTYEVQIFNYVSDGDPGLTTFSGTNTVTLGNLPGAGGANTYGEFATGTFTATNSTETFDWTGAGSTYTVVGAIYVSEVPSDQPPTISVDTTPSSVTAYQNTTTSFTAIFSGTPPITNQWYVSTDNGVTFDEITGATNATLTLTNTEVVTNVEYYLQAANAYGTNHSTPASLSVLLTPPQTITWGVAMGITGDNSLSTNGVYVDAFIPNTEVTAGLTVDGITFNSATSSSGTGGSDGLISFDILSGNNNSYNFTTFPTTAPSSPAFAAVMNAGGTYQNGGAGFGIVTLGGLTAGHIYSVQVFNYANDSDPGLTTLSGTTPVTLSNLPGSGGTGTEGEFATGTFTASSTNESFYWNGDGSGYTVLGDISVMDISSLQAPTVSEDITPSSVTAILNSITTFSAAFLGTQPITNQWQVSVDGGSTFNNIVGATNLTLTITNSQLVTNIEYRLSASNAYGTNHTDPATLTVIIGPTQNLYWGPVTGLTGDTNLLNLGTYFDALIPNPSDGAGSTLIADGVTFNIGSGTLQGPNQISDPNTISDALISFTVTNGDTLGYAWPNSFPTNLSSSVAFADVMDAGGLYSDGGSGEGYITISGLTLGDKYQVQLFDWAAESDPGLTTYSGNSTVTLSNLAGSGGSNTDGEYVTGTFVANNTNEVIYWQGAGSGFTVVGSISVFDITGVISTVPPDLNLTVANGQLQLSWPADHTGWTLQMQTNSLSVGLSTNWVNVSGSTSVDSTNIPITTTNSSVFFRLVYP